MLKSRQQKVNAIFFLALFAAYLAVTLFLFHRQSVSYGGKYHTDIHAYTAHMQGFDTGYDFPYPVMFMLGRFFMLFTTPVHAIAFAVTALNGLSALILKYFMDRYVLTDQENYGQGILSSLLVFALLFVSCLYPLEYLGKSAELTELRRYIGAFSPNPYHNATYLAARPFAILSFFLMTRLLGGYEQEEKAERKLYLLFALSLFLATMTKPSYTLVAVSCAGVIMLYRLLRSRFKGMKAFWKLGVCFIPTFAALLYQYTANFTGSNGVEEKGMGFGFLTAWSTASDHVVLSLILGLAFPLTVLLFNGKELKQNGYYRLSWQILLMSLVQLMFLYEKGFRIAHVNFAWGYMQGMFLVFMSGVMVLTGSGKQVWWKQVIQWGLLFSHLICGIDYFRVLLQGGSFL